MQLEEENLKLESLMADPGLDKTALQDVRRRRLCGPLFAEMSGLTFGGPVSGDG